MRDARHYGCSNYRSKGTCDNSLKVKRADLERLVGDSIRHKWMNEKAMARLREEVIAERDRSRGSTDGARAALKAALKRTEAQIARIVDAIADAGKNKSLVERLAKLEAEEAQFRERITALDEATSPEPAEIDDDVEAKILTVAAEIETLLNDQSRPDAIRARETVRSMIDRITVSRHESGAIAVNVKGQFAGLMQAAGLVERHSLEKALARKKASQLVASEADGGDQSVVAGAGFEPAAFRL